MHRTLPLEDVARRTGQPVERLRQWCATGLLACDRVDGEWALPETELATAHALAAVGPRLATSPLPDGARLLVVAFRDHADARLALDEIRTRTGVHPSDVELAPLSIDGMQRVLVAGRVPARHAAAIEAIVVDAGGQLVDGTQGLAGRAAHAHDERFGGDDRLMRADGFGA
ncbi:MAG TPA: hypothetical protein VFJ71_07395 [Candidatus Limnocylindrales bacterium]|nr:hypothetical protein [Candidatus Limnocylindrales bacterium]